MPARSPGAPESLRRDGDRDHLLGEDVQRVARYDRRLDQAFVHPPDHHRALQQIAAELREDPPAADLAHAVTGSPDPLQAARHRLRRLDLQDEVDRPHVDPELQRAGRHQARQLARLQQLLDLRALLARERPVVGARDLLFGEVVQAQRDALRRTPVVHEDDRRAVGAHQLQQLRVDGRPDRRARALASRQGLERIRCRVRVAPPSTRPGPGSSGRAPCAPRRR